MPLTKSNNNRLARRTIARTGEDGGTRGQLLGHAIPVPILRGAKLIAHSTDARRTTNGAASPEAFEEPTQTRLRSAGTTDGGETVRSKAYILEPKSETSRSERASGIRTQGRVWQTWSRRMSSNLTSDHPPSQSSSCEDRAPKESHRWGQSLSCPTTAMSSTLQCELSRRTPLTVHRMLLPADIDSGKPARPSPELYGEARGDASQKLGPTTANSVSVYGSNTEMGQMKIQIETTIQSQCLVDRERKAHLDRTPQTSPTDTVIIPTIPTTLSNEDTADAAALQEPIHNPMDPQGASAFVMYRNLAAIGNREPSTGQCSANGDGSRKPTGFPYTHRPLPLLQPSLQSLRQTCPEKTLSTGSPEPGPTDSMAKLFLSPSSATLAPIPSLGRTVRSETCPALPEMNIMRGTTEERSRRSDQARNATGLRLPLLEAEEADSPVSCSGSDADSDEGAYATPLTSPDASPAKTRPRIHHFRTLENEIIQVDGGVESADEDEDGIGAATMRAESKIREVWCVLESNEASLLESTLSSAPSGFRTTSRTSRSSSDTTVLEPQGLHQREAETELEDATPLVPASPAKGAAAFSCPRQSNIRFSLGKHPPSRHPSALLRPCERNATPRQRRLGTSGVQTPDRFIPSRAATPTKEAFLLEKQKRADGFSKLAGQHGTDSDPFGPTTRRSLRMAEQYATIRGPPPAPRSVGRTCTLVQDAQTHDRRTASAGTIWTVGGTMVTEGVASVTNGRGGRVTSGTSAPHYTADFLRRNAPSEEEVTHGRRLALAMDIVQSARMMECSPSPGPRDGRGRSTWRNGKWEADTPKTRLYPR